MCYRTGQIYLLPTVSFRLSVVRKTPEHTLVVVRWHVASWIDATPEEQQAIMALVALVKCADAK